MSKFIRIDFTSATGPRRNFHTFTPQLPSKRLLKSGFCVIRDRFIRVTDRLDNRFRIRGFFFFKNKTIRRKMCISQAHFWNSHFNCTVMKSISVSQRSDEEEKKKTWRVSTIKATIVFRAYFRNGRRRNDGIGMTGYNLLV